jgi:hypothetical protein
MKAICEGRSTKHQVVQQSLEQYREVFVRTKQQIGVLKGVSSPSSHCSIFQDTLTLSSRLHTLC